MAEKQRKSDKFRVGSKVRLNRQVPLFLEIFKFPYNTM